MRWDGQTIGGTPHLALLYEFSIELPDDLLGRQHGNEVPLPPQEVVELSKLSIPAVDRPLAGRRRLAVHLQEEHTEGLVVLVLSHLGPVDIHELQARALGDAGRLQVAVDDHVRVVLEGGVVVVVFVFGRVVVIGVEVSLRLAAAVSGRAE